MSTTSNPQPEPPTYVFELADFDDHHFLFAFPNEKKRPSARQIQMRRLYDILNLSLHRDDLARAKRAWSILARCKETNWKTMWTLGITLLANDVRVMESNLRKIDYLRTMLLQLPEEVCFKVLSLGSR
jgi:RNA polymerase I-specific transcription initiation factor RRN11